MEIAYFKATCFICWNTWEIPQLPDSAYGEELLIDIRTGKFKYFSWFDNMHLYETLKRFFANNFEQQVKNDNSKGEEARKLILKIADGEHKLLNQHQCPRCKMRISSISDNRTRFANIDLLTFWEFEHLNQEQQLERLNQVVKNGL